MSAKVENTLNQLKVLFLCGLSVMLIYAGRVVVNGNPYSCIISFS